MMNFDAMNATAHLPAIERELDERRRAAATSASLRELSASARRVSPARRALQLGVALLHGAS